MFFVAKIEVDSLGFPKGFAFVNFHTIEEAIRAHKALNGQVMRPCYFNIINLLWWWSLQQIMSIFLGYLFLLFANMHSLLYVQCKFCLLNFLCSKLLKV